jgi:imidazole glycerol-phosphate synthase subunit HisH
MRIAILDYGVGNLHSIAKALVAEGRRVSVERDAATARRADLMVLPGVGAFAPAAAQLAPARMLLRDAVLDGLPTLGICLGMQLLFEHSDEGVGRGLGVFDGSVTRLRASRLPQLGWNSLDDVVDVDVDASGLRDVYYANSFACRPGTVTVATAWSTHESDRFPAIVRTARCVGVQFHPEKCSAPGLRFLNSLVDRLVGSAVVR